ncbi:MAG: hypothetical protein LBG26_05385, partial [Treponema sp.]|nr:hypothetical protein [Treponema sp.]
MKKIPVLAAAAGLAMALFGGCTGKADSTQVQPGLAQPGQAESAQVQAESTTLYIYNWTYYTPDTVIEKFEREYGVTVIYDEFDS